MKNWNETDVNIAKNTSDSQQFLFPGPVMSLNKSVDEIDHWISEISSLVPYCIHIFSMYKIVEHKDSLWHCPLLSYIFKVVETKLDTVELYLIIDQI